MGFLTRPRLPRAPFTAMSRPPSPGCVAPPTLGCGGADGPECSVLLSPGTPGSLSGTWSPKTIFRSQHGNPDSGFQKFPLPKPNQSWISFLRGRISLLGCKPLEKGACSIQSAFFLLLPLGSREGPSGEGHLVALGSVEK